MAFVAHSQRNNFKPLASPGVLTRDPEMRPEKYLYLLKHPGRFPVDNSVIQDVLRELCRSDPLSPAPLWPLPSFPPSTSFKLIYCIAY